MKIIYLDYNATTPVRSEVFKAMQPLLTDFWGNPSSIHRIGRKAKNLLDDARSQVAKSLGAQPSEIVFTSSGTESNNLAVKGVAQKYAEKGRHIITTAVEHPGILETCRYLENNGYSVTYVRVDREGMIDLDDFEKAFRDDTILVTAMLANNETGNIFPIKDMAAIASERGVFFHSDAVQAVGKIPVNAQELGVDMLSISGHKFYAPKGVGALYVRNGIKLENIIHGGHQERGLRAGTENMAGIVALAKACELAEKDMNTLAPKLLERRKKLEEGITARIEEVKLNGHPELRLPNTVNMSFSHVEGESITMGLDEQGVSASSGSACGSGSPQPSHVLMAMGIPPLQAQGSIRFSLGRENTDEDVDFVLDVLPPIIKKFRAMSPLYRRKNSGRRGKEN